MNVLWRLSSRDEPASGVQKVLGGVSNRRRPIMPMHTHDATRKSNSTPRTVAFGGEFKRYVRASYRIASRPLQPNDGEAGSNLGDSTGSSKEMNQESPQTATQPIMKLITFFPNGCILRHRGP